MQLPYKILIPFLVVQLFNMFGGELEMSQNGPVRIDLQPREEICEECLSNLAPELVTRQWLQPCLQHTECALAMATLTRARARSSGHVVQLYQLTCSDKT